MTQHQAEPGTGTERPEADHCLRLRRLELQLSVVADAVRRLAGAVHSVTGDPGTDAGTEAGTDAGPARVASEVTAMLHDARL